MSLELLQSLPVPTVFVGHDLQIIKANSDFFSIFGHGHPSTSEHISEFIRSPSVLNLFRESHHSKHRTESIEEIECRSDRKKRIFKVTVSPSSSGAPETHNGLLGVFQDVTQMKASEKMRMDFVANVSHELRTPLTAILGFTELLELEDLSKKDPHEIQTHLNIIRRNAQRLLDLSNDLLDLSTLESGKDPEKTILPTHSLTEEALSGLNAIAQSKNQQLETHFNKEWVYGDRKRIIQVIVNLVQNAIRYSPNNSRIQVDWENAEDRAGAVLVVRDTGHGIPPENLDRIFERFYRIDSSRNRDQGGTGLGLSIVKHIMIQHDGAVTVKSELGVGTEFRCLFPFESDNLIPNVDDKT